MSVERAINPPVLRIKEEPGLSCGDPRTENRILHGDNLAAMQLLLPEFNGRIKCIYIDPPYNTGNTFTHYMDDKAHAEWLGFMRERLILMRQFLAEDGIIFISIGDEECAYLKVLMDEIFGRKHFCGTLVWEKKKKPSFLDRNMGRVTEFILAYAKNRPKTGAFIYGTTTRGKRYPLNNAGNGLRILRFDPGAVRFKCPDGYYEPLDMSEGGIITRLLDGFEVRQGTNLQAFRLEGEWRYAQAKLDGLMQAGELLTISKVPFRPNHVRTGGVPKKIANLLDIAHCQMSTYEDATEESRALFGSAQAFDYPKPEKLIHTLLNAVTEPGDWVLDAFAGSGTTGAVAHKMGLNWIMIEQGDHCITHLQQRMQKVVAGIDRGGVSPMLDWQGGSGFRFLSVNPR